MLLVLFRHGPAGTADPARGPEDAKRPLSPRGAEKTRRAALGVMRILEVEPRIYSSPLLRAKETADLLAASYTPMLQVELLEALVPGRPQEEVLSRIAGFGEGTVVLVGHEPSLGHLAGVLVFGPGTTIPLKKAGACAIEISGRAAPGQGDLKWLATPRMLRALSK
ncbi:MAG TPA: histidine phosphatase family protein [Candidatus Eisenbacteria bacterium]|nr:histidine phosphatase family protein [Candidatus Eisenbacteria bacterium]